MATYCNSLPTHTHHSDQDLNSFFDSLLNKLISLCRLTAEHAMLGIYSTVHHHITNKLTSQNSTHIKQLPLNTFVLHIYFEAVLYSNKPKAVQIGPDKTIQHLSEVTYQLMAQDGPTIHTHRNHYLGCYSKEAILFPYLRQYHSTPPLLTTLTQTL